MKPVYDAAKLKTDDPAEIKRTNKELEDMHAKISNLESQNETLQAKFTEFIKKPAPPQSEAQSKAGAPHDLHDLADIDDKIATQLDKRLSTLHEQFQRVFPDRRELEEVRKQITLVSNRILSESAAFMNSHLKEFSAIQTHMQAELDDFEHAIDMNKEFQLLIETTLEQHETSLTMVKQQQLGMAT